MTPGLFWHFMSLRWRERMEYRGAFLIGLAAQGLAYLAGFTMIWVVVHRFGTINRWSWEEMAFLYALELVTYAIGAALAYSQTEVEDLVQSGTFDGLLVMPMNPYLALSAQQFNVGYLSHFVIAVSIFAWSMGNLDISWGLRNAVFLGLAILGGAWFRRLS